MTEPLTDLIAIRDLSRAQVDDLLDTARELLPIARRERASVPTLRGRIVCNLFLEDSTRTRLSFDLAAKRLSADVVNFTAAGTSVNKGESLLDTAQTLMALGVDLVVLRTSSAGAPVQLAREVAARLVGGLVAGALVQAHVLDRDGRLGGDAGGPAEPLLVPRRAVGRAFHQRHQVQPQNPPDRRKSLRHRRLGVRLGVHSPYGDAQPGQHRRHARRVRVRIDRDPGKRHEQDLPHT
jgi:hypothetical protein